MDNNSLNQIIHLTSKEIKEKDPIELMDVLIETFGHYKDILTSMAKDPNLDLNEYQQVQIEWGRWSHNFNKPIRERVKECDLFPENDNARFVAKRLSLIFLYWSKCFLYIEAIAEMDFLKNANTMIQLINEMKEIKSVFINTKKEALPKWVTLSQAETNTDQE